MTEVDDVSRIIAVTGSMSDGANWTIWVMYARDITEDNVVRNIPPNSSEASD